MGDFVSTVLIIDDSETVRVQLSRAFEESDYRVIEAENGRLGLETLKKSRAEIDVSEDGWDSEMICYPHVFDHSGRRYMLYNGNGYGASGIGLAVLE